MVNVVSFTLVVIGIFISPIKPKPHCDSTTAITTTSPCFNGTAFQIGNVTFKHRLAVNGIQMHYVIGGQGNPLVLLHGFPETWYEWRHVMPAFAKNYTVI